VNVSQVRTVEVGYRSNVKNKQPREALMLTDDEISSIFSLQFNINLKMLLIGYITIAIRMK